MGLKSAKRLICLGLWLAGCAAGPRPDLRIATGDSGDGLEPHRRLMASFQARHPKLRLQLEAVSGGDYYTRLLTEMASGEAPDIIQLGDEALASFVRRQALLPLEPLQANRYLTGVLAPGMGYLVPKDFTPLVCYCNARLFRAAGLELPRADWSWDEFAELAVRLKADLPGPRSGFLEYLAAMEGGDWTQFEGESTERAITRLQDLVLRGGCNLPEDLGSFDSGLSNFEEGRAAMKISGRWPLSGLRQQFGEDLVILPPPHARRRVNLLYWSGLGIARGSHHVQLAREYVALCASPEGSRAWAGWGLPALRSEAAIMAKDPLESVFLGELEHLVKRAYQQDASWGELGGPALIRLHEAALLYPHRPARVLLQEQAARLALERAARR